MVLGEVFLRKSCEKQPEGEKLRKIGKEKRRFCCSNWLGAHKIFGCESNFCFTKIDVRSSIELVNLPFVEKVGLYT